MIDSPLSETFNNIKFKVDHRSKDRMKVTIKLNKDEALAFKNMKQSLLPEGVDDDKFLKSIFFMGLEQFHKNTMAMMKQYVEENEEKLRSEGVDVDAIFETASIAEEIEDNDNDE